MARSDAYVDFGLEQLGPYRLIYQGAALRAVPDRTQAAFGQPMLNRTAEIESRRRQADPIADPPRAALLI